MKYDVALCHPDEITNLIPKSSGWRSYSQYLIRMTYDQCRMSSGWLMMLPYVHISWHNCLIFSYIGRLYFANVRFSDDMPGFMYGCRVWSQMTVDWTLTKVVIIDVTRAGMSVENYALFVDYMTLYHIYPLQVHSDDTRLLQNTMWERRRYPESRFQQCTFTETLICGLLWCWKQYLHNHSHSALFDVVTPPPPPPLYLVHSPTYT